MVTSGTSNFNYGRDQIIRSALRKIGAISAGETPDAQTITDCSDALNLMVKAWDARGLHLWTESEAILFLQPGQVQYALGLNSPDHATKTNPPNFARTTLFSSAAFNSLSLLLTSTENIFVNDKIGIVLDNGRIFWSTVTVVNSTGVTITDPLTSTAQGGKEVYAYTLPILRPLRVLDARKFTYVDNIETPMFAISRLDYRDLPNKNITGTPTTFFYDPQLVLGQFYIWPATTSVTDAVKFTWMRQIEDFNVAIDTPDLPQEWLSCLIWGLAVEMAPEYDCPLPKYQMLKAELAEKIDMVAGFDREPEPIYFGVSMSGNYSGGSGH